MTGRNIPHLTPKERKGEMNNLLHTTLNGYNKGHPNSGERDGLLTETFDFFLDDLLTHHHNAIVMRNIVRENKTKTTINKKVLGRRLVKRTTPRFIILPVTIEGHFFSYLIDRDNNIVHRVDGDDPTQNGISDRALKRFLGEGWGEVQQTSAASRRGWICGDCGVYVLYYIHRLLQDQAVRGVIRKTSKSFRVGMGEYLEGKVDEWV